MIKINATTRLKATQLHAATAKDAGKLTLMFNKYFGKYKKGDGTWSDDTTQMVEWAKGHDRASIQLYLDDKKLDVSVEIANLKFQEMGNSAAEIVKLLKKEIDNELEELKIDLEHDPKDASAKKDMADLEKFKSCLS